jgi:hypothetical protein
MYSLMKKVKWRPRIRLTNKQFRERMRTATNIKYSTERSIPKTVSNTWFCQRKLMSDLHHISLLAMYAARDLQNINNCCLKIFNGLTVLKCSCFSSVFLANNRTAPLYRLWQTTCKISNSLIHSCRSVSKNVVVEWLTLLLRFSGGPGLKSRPRDRTYWVFRGFPHFLQVNVGTVP